MLLTKRRAVVVISAFVLMIISSFVTATTARAEVNSNDIISRFKKPMPEIPVMSNEEFINSTKPISKKPYDDESLAYSMRIDNTWEEGIDRTSSNFVMSQKLFLELNSYFSKPTISGRSRIEVEGLNMEGNLTAEQWYIKYILEGGYTTEGFITHDDNKVESLIVVMEEDYSYYLRTIVIINGAKVIMVKYYVPTALIQEQASMQAAVLASFKMTHNKKRVMGETSAYRFLDIAEFKYDSNWSVIAQPVRDVDKLSASVLNTKNVASNNNVKDMAAPEGKVIISVISSSINKTLIQEIAEYKEEIESKGMLIAEKIPEDYTFKYAKNIDFAITEVYRGVDSSNSMGEYEFWFSVMVGGNYYYLVMLITPSRNNMFATWAENTENYKILIESFRPMVGAFLERD